MRIHKQPQPQQHQAPATHGGGKGGGAHGAHGPNLARQAEVMAKAARMRAKQEEEEERKQRKRRRGLFAWIDEGFEQNHEERAAYQKLTGRNQTTDLEDSFEAE